MVSEESLRQLLEEREDRLLRKLNEAISQALGQQSQALQSSHEAFIGPRLEAIQLELVDLRRGGRLGDHEGLRRAGFGGSEGGASGSSQIQTPRAPLTEDELVRALASGGIVPSQGALTPAGVPASQNGQPGYFTAHL